MADTEDMENNSTPKPFRRDVDRCGCCGHQAEATSENEGYSDCCNDRIVYACFADAEYDGLIKQLEAERAERSAAA